MSYRWPTITYGGLYPNGYDANDPPKLTIQNSGTPLREAVLRPIIQDNRILAVEILDPGEGYDPLRLKIESTDPGNLGARGKVFLNATGGIDYIQMTTLGDNYFDGTSAVIEGGDIIEPLSERILGRTLAVDVLNAKDNEIILKKGVILSEEDVDVIEKAGIDQIKVRSALTCETQPGICALCYGRDLARGTPVNIGEAVGVIAAQSIGEPGTQLTMRTFHIGGAAQRGAEQSKIEAPFDGKLKFDNTSLVMTEDGSEVVLSRSSEMLILDDQGREKARYRLQYGSKLLKKDGKKVKAGEKLAEWDPYTIPIITEKEGTAHYVDLVEGVSMREITDESTGIGNKVVIDWKQQTGGSNLRPRITLRDNEGEVINLPNGLEARYFMSMNAILSVENGSKVKAGAVLARIPRESSKTRDITGGLPRVAELFEARKPKDFAIISESDGVVEFGADYKAKRRIRVVPQDTSIDPVEYMVWLRRRREGLTRRNYKRIIDLEKESAALIIQAIESIGDQYGIYGFSGYGRENVEFYVIKDIDEPFNDKIKRRIDKITPLHATRMGASIRHAITKLENKDATTKIMFLISDGRPQDRGYSREGVEKEYAVHDTHQALIEARRKNIIPFCLTVDKAGHDYLKEMCGDMGYEVLDNIWSLPERLPMVYRNLTK